MFDSVPSNLPFEPASRGSQPVTRNDKTSGDTSFKLQDVGKKEPEDIFAEIKEPATVAGTNRPVMPQTPVPAKSGSKILILIGIPLVVIALGIGGWYVYGSLTQGSGVNLSQQKSFEATVPSSSEPDNGNKTLQNPVPEPDDSQLAASQASIGILRAQQEQALASATSSAGSLVEVTEVPQNLTTGGGVGGAVKGADADEDGLTDAEEVLLGANPKLKDSDGDGFEDLSEAKNGYDPTTSSGKLENSSYIKNEIIGSLKVMIPKAWVKKAGSGNSIVIDTGAPASISIAMEQFASGQTLLAWLMDKYPGSLQEDYVQDSAKNGDTVIYSKDGMQIWLLSGNTVYLFRYSTNGQAKEFGELLDIMVKQAR